MRATDYISASSQDYLEAILELVKEHKAIRSVDIASKLGVSRASVNKAMGVLKNAGFIEHEPYSAICLTLEGEKVATAVIKRHTVLKEFLIEVLGVSEQAAQEDACKMEHAISIETLNKLNLFLRARQGE